MYPVPTATVQYCEAYKQGEDIESVELHQLHAGRVPVVTSAKHHDSLSKGLSKSKYHKLLTACNVCSN